MESPSYSQSAIDLVHCLDASQTRLVIAALDELGNQLGNVVGNQSNPVHVRNTMGTELIEVRQLQSMLQDKLDSWLGR